jgi:xylulokinase
MNLLALDVGSSSVKSAILKNGKITTPIVRASFPTKREGVRVEVDPRSILRAIQTAIADVGPAAKSVDVIGLSTMAPSWLAMDHEGRPLTPIVTHQDRRSVDIARELEKRVGKQRHLKLAGNRPIPGGISSTTWAWFLKHEPALMKKADLCGHLSTFLHRQLTHDRVTDPSNASFMGFYSTLDQGGWSDELCDAVGIKRHRLPQVIGAEGIGGMIVHSAASKFGLTHGTPMLVGCMDGSAPVLLAGNEPGQLINVTGSTDVLALCTDRPHPHENLLTRAVGMGKRWVSVSTEAAAGSALDWAHQNFFRDLPDKEFFALISQIARSIDHDRKVLQSESQVRFDNHLAGSRTSLEQRTASFTGLTLSTTREDMLRAILQSLARESAARIRLLADVNPIRINRQVLLTGGAGGALSQLLHRGWPGKWIFKEENEATLRGIWKLVE